jgi:hypothetical protein
MIPKISSAGIIGGRTGKNTMSHAEFQPVGTARAFFALSDPISMGLKPAFCGEVVS